MPQRNPVILNYGRDSNWGRSGKMVTVCHLGLFRSKTSGRLEVGESQYSKDMKEGAGNQGADESIQQIEIGWNNQDENRECNIDVWGAGSLSTAG